VSITGAWAAAEVIFIKSNLLNAQSVLSPVSVEQLHFVVGFSSLFVAIWLV
jgi:hypothetical protein